MDEGMIMVAVITAGFAFLGVYMLNRKQVALVAYRLEKLEVNVDKHNNVVERMYTGFCGNLRSLFRFGGFFHFSSVRQSFGSLV